VWGDTDFRIDANEFLRRCLGERYPLLGRRFVVQRSREHESLFHCKRPQNAREWTFCDPSVMRRYKAL